MPPSLVCSGCRDALPVRHAAHDLGRSSYPTVGHSTPELFDTLVVSRVPLDLRADERVRVRGLIRDTTVVELEEQWDVDLADAVADAHDGGLLIVADDVTPVDFPEPLD